jgi:hypothetical protein
MPSPDTAKPVTAETVNGLRNYHGSGELIGSSDTAVSPAAQLPLTIGEWAKGRDTIRVRLDRFNGRDILDVRLWWTDEAGDLRPGRSGITVAVAHLPRLADALVAAVDEARALGLLPPEVGEPPETDGRMAP